MKIVLRQTVSVVDHGIGNIRSVTNALEVSGYDSQLVRHPDELKNASIVVLPGVGNFGGVMNAIQKNGLHEAIRDYVFQDRPFLGICVGMQVLFQGSAESPDSNGYGFFRGELNHLSCLDSTKVTPSVGWKELIHTGNADGHALKEAYFVHSYFAAGIDDADLISSYIWEGHKVPGHVGRGRVHGVQFHPEKSRLEGLRFLHGVLRDISK